MSRGKVEFYTIEVNFVNYRVKRYEQLPSTNRTAKEMAQQGAGEGLVIVAAHQTAGRGRFGRSFHSPDGTGLYMSVVLRPDLNPEQVLYLTTAAAVAVAQTVEAMTGECASVKWVNDVYCRGKKVAGILTEGEWRDGKLQYAVLGIGINLAAPKEGFPADIADKAGAMFERDPADADTVMNAVLTRFFAYYPHLTDRPHLAEYRRRHLLNGKTVQLLTVDDQPLGTATVEGIGDDFSLLVRDEHGVRSLSSGDVRVLV